MTISVWRRSTLSRTRSHTNGNPPHPRPTPRQTPTPNRTSSQLLVRTHPHPSPTTPPPPRGIVVGDFSMRFSRGWNDPPQGGQLWVEQYLKLFKYWITWSTGWTHPNIIWGVAILSDSSLSILGFDSVLVKFYYICQNCSSSGWYIIAACVSTSVLGFS